MAAQKEIPVEDAELDALMAELEEATADVVEVPTAQAAAASGGDELEALELEDVSDAPAPAPEQVSASLDESVAEPEPQFIIPGANKEKGESVDADLAALEAELAETTATPEPVPMKISKPAEATRRVVEGQPTLAETVAAKKDPEPARTTLTGAAALKAAADAVAAELPEPVPNPMPKKQAASLNYYLDMDKFRDEIRISSTNIDDAMMQQSGLRAFYQEQAAQAEAQHARLKLRAEIVEAALYKKHRKALLDAGEKATEKMVEAEVLLDPEYVAAKNRVIEAETIAATRRAAVDALKDRKDMLVQIGADRREEGKGALRVLENQSLRDRAMAAAGKAA